MDQQIEIPVETLRQATTILLDRLETSSGSSVTVDKDMFWAIPPEHRSNVYSEPTEFTVGQVTESLQNIRQIVEDPSSATSFALVWLADLLRVAGEVTVE